MGIAVIGLDTAKFVLQARALAKSGKLARRELRGSEVVPFSAAHLACRGCRKRAAPPSHEAVTSQPLLHRPVRDAVATHGMRPWLAALRSKGMKRNMPAAAGAGCRGNLAPTPSQSGR